jgi:hypothetical protein
MADFDEMPVFGKKTAADLMKEIHESTKKKEKIINGTIDEIKGYIKNIGDAVQLGPMLAQYMDVWVKSDEHMIKLLAIVTKASGKTEDGQEIGLSDEEKSILIKLSQEINNPQAQA